jgi:hypothetical protein
VKMRQMGLYGLVMRIACNLPLVAWPENGMDVYWGL